MKFLTCIIWKVAKDYVLNHWHFFDLMRTQVMIALNSPSWLAEWLIKSHAVYFVLYFLVSEMRACYIFLYLGCRCWTCREKCNLRGKPRWKPLYFILFFVPKKIQVSFVICGFLLLTYKVGAGYLPSIFDVKLLDEVIKVKKFFVHFIFLIV